MKRAIALMMLNGSLDDAVIVPYLDGLLRAKYEGVCMHPRDGLLVPYLSRAYWQQLDRIIALCRKRDLEVWFYDEFPFPSGAAGGAIPELYPAARVRTLQFCKVETKPNAHGLIDLGAGPLLALLRYTPGNGSTLLNVRDVTENTGPHCDTWVWGQWHNRFYTGASRLREELHERGWATRFTWTYLPETPLEDDCLLAVRLQTVLGEKGWPGMPDVTLPEVTDLFLDKVYRPLAGLAQKHDLKNVPVFQDEVSFYAELPWNREIEARLRPVWGEEIYSKMAALYRPAVEGWEQTRLEYRRACQDAFKTNWFARVAEYCHDNGLRMTGHLSGEESILGHCQLLGNIFENLSLFDIPGYDLISSPIADDVNRCQATGAKLVQSAAWLAGRNPVMCEVFGAHGFHHDLQKARTELAWLAAHDISIGADHSAYVSALGPRKYDAPPVSNRFNPLNVARCDLWNWHSWFCDLLQEYSFDPETLVLFPVESLARFSYSEKELWQDETSLLETFFHFVCAHSLDVLFVPSEVLHEIEPCIGGFRFRNRVFRNFVVPPVHSIHEDTWEILSRLRDQDGFSWALPKNMSVENRAEIRLFGPNCAPEERREVKAHVVSWFSEPELIERKANAFSSLIQSHLSGISSDVTVIKSLRSHRSTPSDALLLLINPHESEAEVQFDAAPGQAVAQPPNEIGLDVEYDAAQGQYSLRLPPRAVAVFKQKIGNETAREISPKSPRRVLQPTRTSIKFDCLNHFRLKDGEAVLSGQSPQPFLPQPVSCLWSLPVPYTDGPPLVPAMSDAQLPEPQKLEVCFTIELKVPLQEMLVLLDEDSTPLNTVVSWDDAIIPATQMDIYEQSNTVFPLTPQQLVPGVHRLHIRSFITNAAQGILENPVLVGRFGVITASPLSLGFLPEAIVDAEIKPWREWGMPEGYGPVDYWMSFVLSEDEAVKSWTVCLPECVGVAKVSVNNENVGRSAWEPRRLPIPKLLQAGENHVDVLLYGSWNNIFSDLNPICNGLSGQVHLIESD